MIECYLSLIKEGSEELMAISKNLVADAFFLAFDFVDGITTLEFNFVGQLKENAYLCGLKRIETKGYPLFILLYGMRPTFHE